MTFMGFGAGVARLARTRGTGALLPEESVSCMLFVPSAAFVGVPAAESVDGLARGPLGDWVGGDPVSSSVTVTVVFLFPIYADNVEMSEKQIRNTQNTVKLTW